MIGETFGRWAVLGEAPRETYQRMVLCRCACGVERVVRVSHLKSGGSKSCGCIHSQFKHGHGKRGCRTKTFKAWVSMRRRCLEINNKSFPNYGGRGITVSERWADFTAFLDDMGECPPGGQIDRIDNNGNYEPGNCRWLSSKENNRNKSNNKIISYEGKSMSVAGWAEHLGCKPQLIYDRLQRGWDVGRAFITS